ncbi:YdiU family protein [Pseudaminobacter sp. 19-2017]|uniref:Protein nucleotidyltransferase YdiU n=1 Tax=Pseudaminobacter soli (ex Zhang et al. 2022) TaxID=2831468 RepID=A0A942I3G7_9HYPH|nr:YdiU family protein [Pseudaminobacter soli]MBS3650313.1 YdiU family protein [Pseudaminobacter soli]
MTSPIPIDARENGRPTPPPFENTYAALPDRFFSRPDPNPVSSPWLIRLNRQLADELGLDPEFLESPEGVAMLAGNRFPDNTQPIAQAYAGHQFGNLVPQLGDGRALLIGEVIDRSGRRRDIQLKGSGPTRFSRGGDGRAAVGPVLREYIVSEAMAAMGIPTTRSLAAVLTGDPVFRERRLPGAVLTRVAASHIRIGTFQYFAIRGDTDGVKMLADYAIDRHYPSVREQANPYISLLRSVIQAQAELIARWMLIGFIHGVMNTDNMSISGETIDYGPCAFMDAYHPATVFSSIDQFGRYGYANQPRIAVWNLARLAETLLPLFSEKEDEAIAQAEEALRQFQSWYEAALHAGLSRKLALFREEEGDLGLISDLLETMSRNEADFTLTFRRLADDLDAPEGYGATRTLFRDPAAFDAWAVRWHERLSREPEYDADRRQAMNAVNPKYIPRNHRIEAVINAAVDSADFAPFEELLTVVTKPFDEQPEMSRYADPPLESERVLQTFCGT